MPRLSDRMMRADTLADGRLLRVSPSARLLAIVLESLAEPTGVLKPDEDEIRSVAPFYLANAAGKPPTTGQIAKWIAELVANKWAVEYEHDGVRLLYLKGFGNRQQGANVCLGISATTGEIASHLPTPPCVRDLKAHTEKGSGTARKMLPVHCDTDYSLCPCELLNPSPQVPEPYAKGEEKEGQEKEGLGDLDLDVKTSGAGAEESARGTDPAALISKMLQQTNEPIDAADVERRITSWRKAGYSDPIITAAVERTELAPAHTFIVRLAAAVLAEQKESNQ